MDGTTVTMDGCYPSSACLSQSQALRFDMWDHDSMSYNDVLIDGVWFSLSTIGISSGYSGYYAWSVYGHSSARMDVAVSYSWC